MNPHQCKTIVVRLRPGDDLEHALSAITRKNDIKAGVIISLVGSLKEANLRMAGAFKGTQLSGPLEIVSATGTLSTNGMHVHISVSNQLGETIGGHLLSGCIVYTTIELVIHDLSEQWTFSREHDHETAYDELLATPASG